jgi:hypothetical protein
MTEDQQRWEGLFRGSVLSTAITKHVSYLTSADTRAQGLILLNSALIPLALSGFLQETLRYPSLLCLLTALLTICLCIFSLYPKRIGVGKGRGNLLHYAEFGRMGEEAFVERMKEHFADKEKLAEAAVRDLYHLGSKIVAPKYFFLRCAYAVFLVGQLSAVLWAVLVIR